MKAKLISGLVLLRLLHFVTAIVPSALERPLTFEVAEEQKIHSLVGNVKKGSRLDLKYTPDVLETLRFSILSSSNDYFRLDPVSGVLEISKVIDRDVICPQLAECQILLNIAVQPQNYFDIIKVVVRILDLNDNSPTFAHGEVRASIPESTQPGVLFLLQQARDPDSPVNGIVQYDLVYQSTKFRLATKNNSDGTFVLQLVLTEPLDREQEANYKLVLVARDGGSPPNSASQVIRVDVLDVNDNSPVFDRPSYEVQVQENAPVDFILVQVQATDSDLGPNGEVFYRFNTKTAQMFGDQFEVNEMTGDVVVKSPLDYERQKVYNLGIEAVDGGVEPQPTPVKVVVHVVDVNDNPPVIKINSETAQVEENSPPNTFVTHFSVEDLDGGRNGNVSCSLLSTDFRLAAVYKTGYKIVTVAPLDRETRSFYPDLVIRCHDFGTPRLNSDLRLSVRVTDVNDHEPKFAEDRYSVSIQENNSPNEFIIRVEAVDLDEGLNGTVRYEFIPNGGIAPADVFHLDSHSGVITARNVLDRENVPLYRLYIRARDLGLESKSSTAIVTVSVLDQDDNPPRFERERFTFEVYENEAPSLEVGRVVAEDPDLPPNNKFSIYIEVKQNGVHDNGNGGPPFSVNPLTGQLRTTETLDREQQDSYDLPMIVQSDNSPYARSSALVTVKVIDRNDHDPVTEFPNEVNNTVHVSNRAPIGYVATTVKAVDLDEGLNSKLTFETVDYSKNKEFIINRNNGEVIVNSDLTDLDTRVFILGIRVSDRGSPVRSAMTTLNIVINKATPVYGARIGAPVTFDLPSTQIFVVGCGVAGSLLLAVLLGVVILVARRRKRAPSRGTYILGKPASTRKNNSKVIGSDSSDRRLIVGESEISQSQCQNDFPPPPDLNDSISENGSSADGTYISRQVNDDLSRQMNDDVFNSYSATLPRTRGVRIPGGSNSSYSSYAAFSPIHHQTATSSSYGKGGASGYLSGLISSPSHPAFEGWGLPPHPALMGSQQDQFSQQYRFVTEPLPTQPQLPTLYNILSQKPPQQLMTSSDNNQTGFSDWLNAENFNLQRSGQVYRVADLNNKKCVRFQEPESASGTPDGIPDMPDGASNLTVETQMAENTMRNKEQTTKEDALLEELKNQTKMAPAKNNFDKQPMTFKTFLAPDEK